MKQTRFSEAQIVKALKANESGRKVEDISRELGISTGTFYAWRKKYAGLEASDLKRLKALELENAKLKRMYADQALDIVALKDVLSKKW